MKEQQRTRLFTFGSGTLGELGHDRNEDATGRPEATEVDFGSGSTDSPASVTSVALGNDHSLALLEGRLYRWGLLCRGRLSSLSSPGDDQNAKDSINGVVVPLPAPMSEWLNPLKLSSEAGAGHLPEETSVVAIAAGGSNSYILTDIGEVFVLGQLRSLGGDPGQLRHLWGCPSSLELQVRQIAAGWRHCLILTQAGTVFAIGDDEHGQCAGNGTGQVPVPLPEVQEGVVGLAAGACHSVAWCSDGMAFTWGHGGAGRLGHGTVDSHRTPLRVQVLSELKVVHSRCGANFTIFVTSPQRALMFGGAGVRVWSCGGNQYGQLGQGDMEEECLPQVLVPKVIDFRFEIGFAAGTQGIISVESLECGAHHTLCLTRPPGHDRLVLWAWGSSAFGQCGRVAASSSGAGREQRSSPMPVVDFLPPSRHWPVAVAAGRTHSAVLAKPLGMTTRLAQAPQAPTLRASANASLKGGRRLGGRFQVKGPELDRAGDFHDSARHQGLLQGDVIEDFCAKLLGTSVPRSISIPRRSPERSLHSLVALGEEALRCQEQTQSTGGYSSASPAVQKGDTRSRWSSLRRDLSSPALGADRSTRDTKSSRRLFAATPLRPKPLDVSAPLRQRVPRSPASSRRQAGAAWWQGDDSDSEESPQMLRPPGSSPRTTRLRVSQSEAALSSLRHEPETPEQRPAPPVMSLSEQRWSGVHHLLRDLEHAVACVVKRRQAAPAGHAATVDAHADAHPRLRGSKRTTHTIAAHAAAGHATAALVHQDPVACRPPTPTPGPPGGADRSEPLFRRQSSASIRGIDAETQVDLCGHGMVGWNTAPKELPGVEQARLTHGEKQVEVHDVENAWAAPAVETAAPFQLGSESPKPSPNMSLDDSTVDPEMLHEEPTAATEAPDTKAAAAVTESVKHLEQRSSARMCHRIFVEWCQHVAGRKKAPRELRSIMDSLDSGSESLVSMEDGEAVEGNPTGPYALGDSSEEEAGTAVQAFAVAKSAAASQGGATISSGSSSGGEVEHLEVLESASSSS